MTKMNVMCWKTWIVWFIKILRNFL